VRPLQPTFDMAIKLLTLGHGTATANELAVLIRNAGIELIVDVRTVPKSRRHPHVWLEQMELWVPQLSGSAYLWQPALGGFRTRNQDSSNVALRHPSFRAYATTWRPASSLLPLMACWRVRRIHAWRSCVQKPCGGVAIGG